MQKLNTKTDKRRRKQTKRRQTVTAEVTIQRKNEVDMYGGKYARSYLQMEALLAIETNAELIH